MSTVHRMVFRVCCRMLLVMWMCDIMTQRQELIQIRNLGVGITMDSDNFDTTGRLYSRIEEIVQRLDVVIENLEEMLELDTQYAQDVFEYLCEAPMEFTSMLDPPESRNPGIEQLISQLNVIIENQNEIERSED